MNGKSTFSQTKAGKDLYETIQNEIKFSEFLKSKFCEFLL